MGRVLGVGCVVCIIQGDHVTRLVQVDWILFKGLFHRPCLKGPCCRSSSWGPCNQPYITGLVTGLVERSVSPGLFKILIRCSKDHVMGLVHGNCIMGLVQEDCRGGGESAKNIL